MLGRFDVLGLDEKGEQTKSVWREEVVSFEAIVSSYCNKRATEHDERSKWQRPFS